MREPVAVKAPQCVMRVICAEADRFGNQCLLNPSATFPGHGQGQPDARRPIPERGVQPWGEEETFEGWCLFQRWTIASWGTHHGFRVPNEPITCPW